MKRILIISALLLAVVFSVTADRRRLLLARNVGAASCSTVHAQNGSAENGDTAIGSTANNYFAGLGQYNPGADISLCKIDYILSLGAGSISSKTFTVVVYAMSGNDFTGSILATSDPVTGNNSWSDTTVSFTFASPVSLSNGGSYAIAVTMSESDGSNYATYSRSAAGGISGSVFAWPSTGIYVTGFSTADPRVTLYK